MESNSFSMVGAMAFLLLVSPGSTAAEQQAPQPTIVSSRAGDCRVVVDVPGRTRGSRLEVELNKGRIAHELLDLRPLTVVLPLGAPLGEGDELRARLDTGPWHTTSVGPAPDPPTGATCGTTAREPNLETRPVFEALGFLGRAYDQFAPAIAGNYLEGEDLNTSSRSRYTAGMDMDYRVLGREEDRFQFWVAARTLYGLRAGDVDCREAESSPVCAGSNQEQFLSVLEHSSSLEAHFSLRLEFLTLQPSSTTPIRVFAAWQSGFVHLANAPKVSQMDHLGLGVIAPVVAALAVLAGVALLKTSSSALQPCDGCLRARYWSVPPDGWTKPPSDFPESSRLKKLRPVDLGIAFPPAAREPRRRRSGSYAASSTMAGSTRFAISPPCPGEAGRPCPSRFQERASMSCLAASNDLASSSTSQ